MSKNILNHIAFIMDGNGRWAKLQNKPRNYGHEMGAKALENVISILSNDDDIKEASFYCFSKENWQRPTLEVKTLMLLLSNFINGSLLKMQEANIDLKIIGDLSESSPFSKDMSKKLSDINQIKLDNPLLKVNLYINYSSQDEIAQAASQIIKDGNEITADKITEKLLENTLPLDLIVRTSGEQRLSNFMLWQSAYAELMFTSYHWPEISQEKLTSIKQEYYSRNRRFGKI